MSRRVLSVWLPILITACQNPPDHPFESRPVVFGSVVDYQGEPPATAFVTNWSPDSSYSVSVQTGENGEFVLPLFDDRSVALAAHGPGLTTTIAPPTDRTGIELVVEPADPYVDQPSSRFLSLLPDGETKRRFILDCTGCHQFDRQIVDLEGKRRPRESWIERINQMIAFSGASSQFPVMSPSRNAEETADWLVAHLTGGDLGHPEPTRHPERSEGPLDEDPARHPERSEGSLVADAPRDDSSARLGTAARATVTEYPIPEQGDLPHDLAIGGRGHVIVTGMFTHLMYDLDPETGEFETVPIPVQFANPRAVEIDRDGVWWALLGFPRMIARYDPDAQTWSSFEIGMYPHSIVPGVAGKVWFNGHFTKDPELIGSLDIESGIVETFEVPVPSMPDGGTNIPYGLRVGPDGALWGTELVGNRLIRFRPDDKMFSVYPLPTPFSGPRRPDVASDGTVWIPEYANNRLAVFDPAAETFTEFELPIRDSLPYVVRYHPRTGHIWVAAAAADAVFRFDRQRREFTTYLLPTPR
ncbi:MAG TPA: hypothetical protein VJB15_12560, partial [Rhodothermia bacterium]|nr:hypothetical protein [Rhodothermia bacterium]